MENVQLENYPQSISVFRWKLPTRTLAIVFGVVLLCINIFFLLQNYEDTFEAFQQHINKISDVFNKPFANVDMNHPARDAVKKSFDDTASSLIPEDVIKSYRIGRMIILTRSSVNILAIVALIYGAARYKSLYLLVGFIYWCTQSAVGWPLIYYFMGDVWDAKMIVEVLVTIKLEICFLVVTWGCYKYGQYRKANATTANGASP